MNEPRAVLWNLVQATLFRFSLPRAYAWRRFLLRLFGARLAPHAGVRASSKILHPWLFDLGDWTMVADRVVIYNLGAVKIGDHSVLSQDVYVCAGTRDHTKFDLPIVHSPITIGAGVWIAAGAFIGPGAVVGDNSVVGAQSVVRNEIPGNVIAAGNPCRVIKPREMKAS